MDKNQTHTDTYGFAGSIQQFQDEKKFLRNIIKLNDIDLYLEIGTLWGGTAIIAALAGAKKVITIDSMDGLRWHGVEPWYPHEMLSKERILGNFYAFGVEDVVELIHAKSYPFPLKDVYPDIVLIDGDHENEPVHDWESVKDITKKVVMFHDYCNGFPVIANLIKDIALYDPDWELKFVVGCTAVLKRKNIIIKQM